MQTKFTPGPWQHAKRARRYENGSTQTFGPNHVFSIDREPKYPDIEDEDLSGVCMVYGIPLNCTMEEIERDRAKGVTRYDEALANARLIAAAPELYEAAKAMVDFWDTSTASSGKFVRLLRDEDYINRFRAALRKAEGVSTEGK